MSKAGHHGDVLYKFEDNGFAASPTDSTWKVWGGNTVMETFDGSHQAVRVFNADRQAAEIVKQVFDGAWSISGEITEPPWWLQGIFGSPVSTNVSGALYDHEYSLSNGGDPETLKLALPTDGFTDTKTLQGCAVANFSIDQSVPGNPEFSISGAYASEPTTEAISPSVPSFAERTFHNREASLTVDGSTVGKAQSANVDLSTGTELIGEIGSGEMVDFIPKTFEPDPTYSKILAESQTVDPHDRFIGAATPGDQVDVVLAYDNGESSDATYKVQFTVSGSFPNDYSESGRNDPGANLTEELAELAEDMTATITEDESAPPT